MKIIFLGGPGTGKSTVGQRLARDLKWPWISSGAILRESNEEWVINKLKTAQLFDDEMVAGLVFSRLSGLENAIIDGFPRTLRQAELMLEQGQKPDMLVEMVVPLEEIETRLGLRGRDQDTPEVIEERYSSYEATKSEIMAYLAGNGVKVISVDGVGTMDEVYVRTVRAIKEA